MSLIHAQTSVQDSIFATGTTLYSAKNFTASEKCFDTLIANQSWTKYRTASQMFRAKIALNRYQYPKAELLLKELKKQNLEGAYFHEVEVSLIEVLWKQKKKLESFSLLVRFTASAQNDSLRNSLIDDGGSFLAALSRDEIESLTQTYKDKTYWDIVLLFTGAAKLKLNETSAAKEIFLSIITKFPNSPFHKFAVAYFEKADDLISNSQKSGVIAVILPNDSTDRESNPVNQILDGIKFGLHNYNTLSENKYGLLVYHTNGDTNKLIETVKQLNGNKNLAGVIGPLYSNDCKLFLSKFTNNKIAIVSPTATDNNLAGVSNNFIQLNSPFNLRGKSLAKYVYDSENKRKAAVVYSTDTNSVQYASGFIKEFVKLGGQINEIVYDKSKRDYSSIMSPLKTAASDCDAIFIPVSEKRFVEPILSALTLSKIQLPVYANQEWIEAPGLDSSPNITSQLTIISDYFIDFSDTSVATLNYNFNSACGYDINKFVSYGFSASKFLFDGLQQSTTEHSFISQLKSEPYNSLHGLYGFNSERINTSVNILRYINGRYLLVNRTED